MESEHVLERKDKNIGSCVVRQEKKQMIEEQKERQRRRREETEGKSGKEKYGEMKFNWYGSVTLKEFIDSVLLDIIYLWIMLYNFRFPPFSCLRRDIIHSQTRTLITNSAKTIEYVLP